MSEKTPLTVLIVAGGTGGHVTPALATAHKLRERGVDVQWLGTRSGVESRMIPAADIPLHFISMSGLRGKGIVGGIFALIKFFWSILQSLRIVVSIKPQCVLGMGGYVSAPGGLAAWLLRCPLVIHEQNAVAGSANKLLARFAKRVLVGFPIDLKPAVAEYVGNPVRLEIISNSRRSPIEGRQLNLLILGGSQGSSSLNKILPQTLQALAADCRPNVWHQTGVNHRESVSQAYRELGLNGNIEAFIDDIGAAYRWADLVLCRAGALTLAEICAAGVASILVPLPNAIDDHQRANARYLVDGDAAILLEESELGAERLGSLIKELAADSGRLLTMALRAGELSRPQAAAELADICVEVAYG